MKINKDQIKRILLIKPRGIGDIVLSTIVLKNINNHFPSAIIHYLVEEFAQDSLRYHPIVDKVLTMKKSEFVLKVAHRIRKERYDLVIDLYSNPRTAQITFLSGAKFRAGYSYKGRKYAYNVPATSERGNVHSAEHNLELLKCLDIPVTSKEIQYHFSEKATQKAIEYFNKIRNDVDFIVGIVPSGGWESKRCDKEKWVEIIDKFRFKDKSNFKFRFLILWGPGDEKDVEYINNKLPEITTVAPKTSVDELAALISQCDLIIANDSGPMHIAAALNVAVIGLFGPTDPAKHGPYSSKSAYILKEDLHCIKCNMLVCPYNHECMKELDVDEIINNAESLLSRKLNEKD